MTEVTNFLIAPKSLSEAMEIAKMIASSNFCPLSMKGKPGDVIIACQMGAEVGLSPMQALQNIAVINGRPCLWGDGALAVVQACPSYESHREWFEGNIKDGTLTAYCGVTRRGSEEYVKTFSMENAKKAKLWDKAGVWQQYPERMLQMRARAFAIRDKFADALRGIAIREEVEDFDIPEKKKKHIPITIQHKKEDSKVMDVENIEINDVTIRNSLNDSISLMDEAKDKDLLKDIYVKAYKKVKDNPDLLTQLIDAKDRNLVRLGATVSPDVEIEPVDETRENVKIDESELEGNPY